MTQSRTTLWLFAGAGLIVLGGLAVYWTRPRTTEDTTPTQAGRKSALSSQVSVYLLDANQELLIARRLETGGSGEAQAREVLEELVRISNDEQNAQSAPLPPDTSFHSIAVNEDLVTIDFDANFRNQDFWGGSEHEYLALQALVNSLTEIPGIRRVRLLIDGKPIESLGGHVDLSEPLERDESVIARKEAPDRDLAHRDPGARSSPGQP